MTGCRGRYSARSIDRDVARGVFAGATSVVLLVGAFAPAASQSPASLLAAPRPPFALAARATSAGQARSGGSAFAIELLGGAAGSAAGFGLGVAITDECGTDDLECDLGRLGVALLMSTAGSAAGAFFAGRLAETQPSGLGATIGAVAGAFAGMGVVHVLSEDVDATDDDVVIALSYMATQGLLSAIGSRWFASLR